MDRECGRGTRKEVRMPEMHGASMRQAAVSPSALALSRERTVPCRFSQRSLSLSLVESPPFLSGEMTAEKESSSEHYDSERQRL